MRRTLLFAFLATSLLFAAGCDDEPSDPTDTMADATTGADTTTTDDTATSATDATTADDADTAFQCTRNEDCATNRCNAGTGQCVECLSTADCSVSTPVCSIEGTCIECERDSQCEDVAAGSTCLVEFGICQECVTDSECTDPAKPICSSNRRCGTCRGPFDCTEAAAPLCVDLPSGEGACVAVAEDTCTGDDASEANSDDGPAGATDITPPAGETTSIVTSQGLCNLPQDDEADWFKITVEAGTNLDITIDWPDADVDIDVTVYGDTGFLLGETLWQKPEVVSLTHLPAGDIYIALIRFDTSNIRVAPYSLTVETSPGGCTTAADCAAEYVTQLPRLACMPDGACERIIGEGMLAEGEACDSPNDCASDRCGVGQLSIDQIGLDIDWHWAIYSPNADQRGVCRATCQNDANCAIGEYCTTVFGDNNYCSPQCQTDLDCPIHYLVPPETGVWQHLPCNNGVCQAL